MKRIRNPSPPPGFTNFRSNMHVEFLKPMYSLQTIDLPMDLFKNLFISSKDVPKIAQLTVPSDLEDIPPPKNLQLIPEAKICEATNVPSSLQKEASKDKEPEESHKKSRKSVKKHKSTKKERISDDDQRRYHKGESSRYKKKYGPEYSVESDLSEVSKSDKRHKSHSRYRNVSESDSSDYYEKDSRKKTHRTHKHQEYKYSDSDDSYSRSLREYARHKNSTKGYDTCDSDRSAEADRHHKSHKDYRKKYDASDSDRSRGSAEADQYHRHSSRKEYVTQNSDRPDSRLGKSYEYLKQDLAVEPNFTEAKFDPNIKFKQEYEYEVANSGHDSFYCKICKLHLNSQTTFDSHISGKRHKKAVMAQKPPEILQASVSNLALAKEMLNPLGRNPSNQVVLHEESQLQYNLASYTENPVIGLDYLQEQIGGKETAYYCELCDAQCMLPSVIPHLIGQKHQLKFLKEIDERFYHEIKDFPRRYVTDKVNQRLFRHERKYGRGNITVITVQDPNQTVQEKAGPSWRNPDEMWPQTEMHSSSPRNEDPLPDFDPMTNDYYCKTCDAHMNNYQMYEAHRRGKRHLKNEKKTVAEREAQNKDARAPPGTISELEKIISKNNEDVFVGLNFIRETLSENGPLFLCYVCGTSGCDTAIIDHLLTLKHRMKYLETVHEKGMIPNAIHSISELEVSPLNREALVLCECEKIEKKYGRGKVQIYISKSASGLYPR